MIVAIALSRDVLSLPATFGFGIIFVGLIVHFVLSVIFVLVLAVIIAPFSLDSSMRMTSLAGVAFGVALYLVNFYFYGMSHLFPWLADARSWASFVSHIVFGLVAADTYLRLETKEEAGVSVRRRK